MRLSLIVPYNISNYILGGSAVKSFDFIMGTAALLPMVIFFVYIGTTLSSIEASVSGNHEMSTMEIVIMVVSAVIATAIILFQVWL